MRPIQIHNTGLEVLLIYVANAHYTANVALVYRLF
jgi:hypothetical protein